MKQRAMATIIAYSTQLSDALQAEMPSWADHQCFDTGTKFSFAEYEPTFI